MRVYGAAAFAAGLLIGSFSAAQAGELRWFKGNTHSHSLWSDGDSAPEMVAQWYVDHGYQFLVMSEHHWLQEGERWFSVVPDTRLRPGHVDAILARFGADWPDLKDSNGRQRMRLKTHDELSAHFNKPGAFLLIPGEEITTIGGVPHVNAINIRENIRGQHQAEMALLATRYIAEVKAQSERFGVPTLAHLNHLNYNDGVTTEELLEIADLRFFEVYNGHPACHTWGRPNRGMPSSDRHWDVALSMRLLEDPTYVLYGVGVDDAHDFHEWGMRRANPGRGWIRVLAPELSAEGILGAMNRGDFYASTGVRLADMTRGAEGIRLRIDAEEGVTYTTQFIGTRKGFDPASEARLDEDGAPFPRGSRIYSDEIGAVLHETDSLEPAYAFEGDEWYVRARITTDRKQENPYSEGDVWTAWVQPVHGPAAKAARD